MQRIRLRILHQTVPFVGCLPANWEPLSSRSFLIVSSRGLWVLAVSLMKHSLPFWEIGVNGSAAEAFLGSQTRSLFRLNLLTADLNGILAPRAKPRWLQLGRTCRTQARCGGLDFPATRPRGNSPLYEQSFSTRVTVVRSRCYETRQRVSRSPRTSHHTQRTDRNTRADVCNGGTSGRRFLRCDAFLTIP